MRYIVVRLKILTEIRVFTSCKTNGSKGVNCDRISDSFGDDRVVEALDIMYADDGIVTLNGLNGRKFEYSIEGLSGSDTSALRTSVVGGLREGESEKGEEEVEEIGLLHFGYLNLLC
jgi:hypothetical protein